MDDLTVGNSLNIGEIISTYGFPIIAAAAMGYFIFFIWKWVTDSVDPVIGDSHMTLIALIDRVRMLDNDLIRLNAKLDMILQEKERNEAARDNITVNHIDPGKRK
jgi:hypothetical protein|tara:strand:+ start:182 stop:496 length:315 start_codon:yes stop_codon:yes gene_type:complete